LSDLSYQYKTYLLSTFILACGALPIAVLLLHTQDVGFKLADIPLFYMMYNLAYAIFSIIAGKLADKIGDVLVLILGYICLLVGYLLFNFYNSVTALVSGFVIIGLFSAFTDSTTRSYAGRITKPENRGLAFDYINGAAGFGVLISGIGGGYTWQYLGDSVALIIGAVITIIGLILLMFTQIAPKQKII
jgi:MFS family permease